MAAQERELVKLDAQGQTLPHIGGLSQDFLDAVGMSDAVDLADMTVDRGGVIYVSTSDNSLLKLDGQGKLLGLINGVNQDMGDYATAIAVDGQGQIAWGYDSDVIITNSQGRYVGSFKAGSSDDVEFNLKGQLVGISRTPPRIEVYAIGR